MELTLEIITVIFLAAFFAGLIDTIAGGGGLLTLPTLLWVGMTPIEALSTNKLQSVFGTFTASSYFIRKKLVDLKEMKLMIFMAFFGSMIGGFALLQIDSSILEKIIPILLMVIGIYFLLTKNVGEIERHKLISTTIFAISLVFIIGFYDGFFGPGTGSFFTIAFIFFLGYNISKATAQTKVLNFVTNFSSLLFFLVFGEIYFIAGFIMAIGQVLGALIGAKLVVKKGQKLIRPFIVIISFALSIKLLLG